MRSAFLGIFVCVLHRSPVLITNNVLNPNYFQRFFAALAWVPLLCPSNLSQVSKGPLGQGMLSNWAWLTGLCPLQHSSQWQLIPSKCSETLLNFKFVCFLSQPRKFSKVFHKNRGQMGITITWACFLKFSGWKKQKIDFVFKDKILKCTLKSKDLEGKPKESGSIISFASPSVGNGNKKLNHIFQGLFG